MFLADIFDSEIKVTIIDERLLSSIEYRCPILYKEKLKSDRINFGTNYQIIDKDIIYLTNPNMQNVAPYYRVLTQQDRESLPLITYQSLSKNESSLFASPVHKQIAQIKSELSKIPLGGTIYLTSDENMDMSYIQDIINITRKIFISQNIKIPITFIGNKKAPIGILNHEIAISIDNDSLDSAHGYTKQFSFTSLTISGVRRNAKFVARTLAHEAAHGYLSRIGYLLFGSVRFFQPDNDVYADGRVLEDTGHIAYKEERDIKLKKVYPNLLLGHEGAKSLSNEENMINIDNRILPFFRNMTRYFDIDDLDKILLQTLELDIIKWEIFDNRLNAILAKKEKGGGYDKPLQHNFRTANLSKFNFNTYYEDDF